MGFNLLRKKMLHARVSSRIELLQSLPLLQGTTYHNLERMAKSFQEETFLPGGAGGRGLAAVCASD